MNHQFSFPTFADDTVEPVSRPSPPSDHNQPSGERCASIAQFLDHNLSEYAFDAETASAARKRADSTTNTLISQLKSKILQLSQELESKDQALCALHEDLESKDYDLCNTKMEISAVKRDLSIAKQDLSASNLELSTTKVNLSAAKKDLAMFKGKLNGTKRELGMTKKALDIAREQAADIMDEILDYKADCNLATEKTLILDLRLSAATEELALAAEHIEATTRELEDSKTALHNAVNERDHVLLKINHLEGGAGEVSDCDHASDTSDKSSQFFNFYLAPPELVGVRRKRRESEDEDEDDPETPTRPQKKIRILVKEAPAEDMETESTLMSWGEGDSGQGVEEAAQSGEVEELVEMVKEEEVDEETGEEVHEQVREEVKEELGEEHKEELEEELEEEHKEEEEELEEHEEEEEEEEETGEEDVEVDVDDIKDGNYETSEDEADEDEDEEKSEAVQKVSRIIRIRVPLDYRSK